MGFLKNLLSSEPKEVREYWKAFMAFSHAMDQKKLPALEQAQSAYPEPWNGYFVLSLCYDIGLGTIEPDADKAKEYKLKAEEAAKGTEDETWVNSFYAWYQKDAMNFRKTIDEKELKLRRLGVAAINMYKFEAPVIYKHEAKDDADFWYNIFAFKAFSYETQAFEFAFDAWKQLGQKGTERRNLQSVTNKLIKKNNKMSALLVKNNKKVRDGKEVDWSDFYDMYNFVIAYYLLNPSPLTLDEWEAQEGKSCATLGVEHLFDSIYMGSAPAVHEMVELAHASDSNYKFIDNILSGVYRTTYEEAEVGWLGQCTEAGDEEGMRLAMKYWQQ